MFYPKDNVIYDELREVTIAAAVTKGQAVLHNDVFGFYFAAQTDITKVVALVYRMRQVLADKGTGTATVINEGDRLYYVVATGVVSPTVVGTIGTDSYFCGWAKKAAGASDTTVLMNFDGTRYDQLA